MGDDPTSPAPAADPHKLRPQQRPFPCVVFCHGNAGSRVDALPILPLLLPVGISVLAFDFAGAGKSEGDFLSLGHYEKDDLSTVVDFLRASGRVSRVGLWGHSMGAVSCIMYAASGGDEVVTAMVCDSAFSSLDAVIVETAASAKQKLGEELSPVVSLVPDVMIPVAVGAIRRSIISQAGFDIRDVNPLQRARGLLLPVLFAHADDDEMVAPYHALRLHEAYGGNSTLLRFAGNHNSPRPAFFTDSVLHFFRSLLRPDDAESPFQGLVFQKGLPQRGLAGPTAGPAPARARGFSSQGETTAGERCCHSGRTAGSLTLLSALCVECNAQLRAQRPQPAPRARRYPVDYAPRREAEEAPREADPGLPSPVPTGTSGGVGSALGANGQYGYGGGAGGAGSSGCILCEGEEEAWAGGGEGGRSPPDRARGRRRGDEARPTASTVQVLDPGCEAVAAHAAAVGADAGAGSVDGDEGVAWGVWGDGGGSGATAGISFQLSNISGRQSERKTAVI